MSKVAVFLADGFEEIEGLTVVDVLRRVAIEVTTVSIGSSLEVRGAHDITISVDTMYDKLDFEEVDMLVLPGGMPGTLNLKKHAGLKSRLKTFYEQEKWIAAICAAPTVLAELGLLDSRKATCYPTMEKELEKAVILQEPVVKDGHIITGRGMGAAIDFSLQLVEVLLGEETAREVGKAIVYYD